MILNLPYTTLRAFEAVVRKSNFSAAADELGVSQSAVSQHVRSLEQWLGIELLVRGARLSTPTREGEKLARAISEGLGRISEVCNELRDQKRTDNTIVISCLPGFAFTWLFPRLLRFDVAHPDLSISITTDTGQAPFSANNADIAIRYGYGDNPGFEVERLMGERIFPVCAPSLLEGASPITDLESLSTQTLLHDEIDRFHGAKPDWEYWAKQNDLSLPSGAKARRFGQSNMVIQAAIEGLGVALGREPLVIDALYDGRLVRPFSQVADSPLAYWLVYPHRAKESRKIKEFIRWIKLEADNQRPIPDVI